MKKLQDLLRQSFQQVTGDTWSEYAMQLRVRARKDVELVLESPHGADIWSAAICQPGESILSQALVADMWMTLPISKRLLAELRYAGWPVGHLDDFVRRWEARIANT